MYDYIIVGGGSAGCVLASRLSERPELRVCLLEAGPRDWHPAIKIPAGMLWMMKSKVLNWNYYTGNEDNLNGRRLFWPRGRTLGGSSASNAMIYTRGHKNDYDHWENLGNPGWGYEDMLRYFKKSQNQERGEGEFHGAGGPLNVQDLQEPNEISKAFVQAGVQAGHKETNDFNGADQEGGRKSLEILAQPALDEYRGERISTQGELLSDDEIRDYVREKAESIYHPVGTCKMGNDELSVVNHELKVHGVANLRVVDASIMPTLVEGNTNAPVIAIAEKASEMILSEAG